MKTIATHSGKFHTDDVFALAILKLVFPKLNFIRTRDEKVYARADARVDVGFKHDHKTRDYDHHQKGGAGERENGIPYASAGLIWKYYGLKVCKTEEVFNHVDRQLIQHIDAHDVGLATYKTDKLEPYKIDDIIGRMNPDWLSKESADRRFNKAVNLAIEVLKNEIQEGISREKSKKYLLDKIKNSNGKYIVIEKDMPWKETLIEESEIPFVVKYDEMNDTWGAITVPNKVGSFQPRISFPKEWGGLEKAELAKVTGVQDVIFCHMKLFVSCAKSKEGAIKLVELALRN